MLVPAATPVTRPVLLTVATVVVPDIQGVVVAAVPDPVSCVVDPAHTVSVPVIVGRALTVTVAVILHPLLLVKVITLVPTATPVTRPVVLTVATVVVVETQGVVEAAVPEPVNWVVDPTQTVSVPVIVGMGFTVTAVLVLFLHPLALAAVVYTIVAVPAATPVTTPDILTVARVGVKLLQVPPVVVSVKAVVLPTQTLLVPPIAAGAVGRAYTVTVEAVLHPPLLVNVITLVPEATPVTRPVLLTVATPVDADTHGVVEAAVPEPASWVVDPTHEVRVPVIEGKELTVTVAVVLHPPPLVKVITLVPAATPVTRPVPLTVATVVVPDTQGVVVAAVPEPVSCVIAPAQTVKVPVIAGAAMIVTVAVILQPPLLV